METIPLRSLPYTAYQIQLENGLGKNYKGHGSIVASLKD